MELELLKREVRTGNQERESLEEKIKREQKYQEYLKEYGKKMGKLKEKARLEYAEMSKKRDEMSKKRDEMSEEAWKLREELWDKNFGVTETPRQREGTTKRTEDVKRGKKENGE